MNGLDVLQSVQYITVKGKRLAVVDLDDWETLLEWLETVEDVQVARDALDQLRQAGGNRERAGWLKWDDLKENLP
ncbi:MAG: hypothetical protein FOGNACKC_03196 [Anaerolineae bacterium]|nr:hypothetical protein [Anaerolineae bacterium]